jgi:hypothetical protein
MEQSRILKITEGFDTEERLVSAILSCLRSSSNRAYRVELELDAGVGLADVVLYKRQPRTTREMKLLAAIPPRLAPLLDPVNAEHICSCEDLALSLGLTSSSAKRVMRQFRELGLVTTRSSGAVFASVKVPPFQKIISVEAKLSDWSRALVQAYRNRQFADESWVVLDHRFYKPALAQVERFQRSGVGLASVEVTGNLYIHYHAPASPAISTTKRWHAQAALARRVAQGLQSITKEH